MVGNTASDAIELELDENWQIIADVCERLDPVTLALMNRAYWFGVMTGAAVFKKAIGGE